MSTPPPVGKTASVKVGQQMYDDLATMLATGMTVSDAVRSALHIVAGVYRKVWDAGAVPEGTRPTIDRFWITQCDPGQWPERGTFQLSVPTAYRTRPTHARTGPTPAPAGATPGPTGATTSPTVQAPRTTAPMPEPAPRTTGLPPSYPLLPTGVTGVQQRPTAVRRGQ